MNEVRETSLQRECRRDLRSTLYLGLKFKYFFLNNYIRKFAAGPAPVSQCASSPGVFYPPDKINLVNFIRP